MLGALARWIGFLTMAALAAGLILLVCGFFWFVVQIPNEEVQIDGKADGIVVLTGAAARIPDAIELLAAGRGKRLLISGVYRDTRSSEIARLTPLYSKYFSCCIDLDRSALNTFGNAIQARHWAREHNFSSLIIVTSNWHLPRAMTELAHQLPDVTLIAYPVISEKVRNDPWWADSATARLLIGEYLKYLFAQLRLRIDPDTGT
ncbi:MAG TPA: YdcF family protein [Pseudolabrys sp.]|nr:YdcF family protein [Pseudolabrys sp.]